MSSTPESVRHQRRRLTLLILALAALGLMSGPVTATSGAAPLLFIVLLAAGSWAVGRAAGMMTLRRLVDELEAALAREQELARSDSLTGLQNGRAFRERMLIEVRRATGGRAPLTVAYIDIDHFKRVNDRAGHAAGDAVLCRIADSLRTHTRGTDAVARIGGDEFAILLPDTGAEAAAQILENLRWHLEAEFTRDGWNVTASIGAAVLEEVVATPDEMLHHADALMYAAKRRGRNSVRVARIHRTGRPEHSLPAASIPLVA